MRVDDGYRIDSYADIHSSSQAQSLSQQVLQLGYSLLVPSQHCLNIAIVPLFLRYNLTSECMSLPEIPPPPLTQILNVNREALLQHLHLRLEGDLHLLKLALQNTRFEFYGIYLYAASLVEEVVG